MRRSGARRRRSGPSPSPRTTELARVAAALGLFYGPDGKEIAHNLCTAVIDPEGRLARLEVGTRPNRWETADFLKTIYSLAARRREVTHVNRAMTAVPDRRRRFAATLNFAYPCGMRSHAPDHAGR